MNTLQSSLVIWLTWWAMTLLAGSAVAQLETLQGPSLETAAEELQRTVVTLRVQTLERDDTERDDTTASKPVAYDAPPDGSATDSQTPRVTVCSGVLLGRGRVVTATALTANCVIRVSLPGGEQSAAHVRVVDEYSGLSLLELEDRDLAGITCATALPKAGAWVMSGAGWGTLQPVVSFGIVSSTEVTIPRTTFPPLLRCDLRIAQTSSGAAVTNRDGQLIGIVVLADRSREQGGWTYAVPVAHVLRLTRTLEESTGKSAVLVLKRRRPVVGMVLDGDGQTVLVSRVREDSPASKAGLQVGDEILAADNVKIRSVYQALRPVLRKQPGDCVTFLIARENRQLTIPVVLGGGIELPSAPPENFSSLVPPKIDLQGLPHGGVRASSTVGEVRDVGLAAPSTEVPVVPGQVSDGEKIRLLEKALDRYRDVIVRLSQQLEQSESQRARAAAQIKSLEKELKNLPR